MAEDVAGAGRSRGGRPLKDAAKGKRAKYAFRMSDFTRAQIEGHASEAGRSLSEEIEYRIERSLQSDGRLQSVLTLIGGAERVMFASMANGDLRIAIDQAQAAIGGPLQWHESPDKLELVLKHMQDTIARTVSSFARLEQTGVAARTGQHVSKLAD